MVRKEKMFCTKRLFDRDFLYGVFPKAGFVKDPDEFLKSTGDVSNCDRDFEEDKCLGTDDDSPGLI